MKTQKHKNHEERWRQQVPPKHQISTRLHGVTSSTTVLLIFTAVKTSYLSVCYSQQQTSLPQLDISLNSFVSTYVKLGLIITST